MSATITLSCDHHGGPDREPFCTRRFSLAVHTVDRCREAAAGLDGWAFDGERDLCPHHATAVSP